MTAPEIIVKKKSYKDLGRRSYLVFFHPKLDLDKNGNWNHRPAHQMKKHVEKLQDDVSYKEKALAQGQVDAKSRPMFEQLLKKDRDRLDLLNESTEIAQKVVSEDREYWQGLRKELGEKISDNMPTERDYHKRRPNPHKIARMEKEPLVGEKITFQEMKKAYQTISRALDEDSNIANLVKDI